MFHSHNWTLSELMARRSKEHYSVFLSCPAGGVPALISEGVIFAEIEKATGRPLHELAQCVFSSSGGTIASTPIFLRNPHSPNEALYTAEQALEVSKRNAAPLLKRSWQPIEVQGILGTHLGQAKMRDYFGSHIIPLHNTKAQRPEDVAKLVYKIETSKGKILYNPNENELVAPLVQASSAVPVKFKSVTIGDNQLCDFGHVHEAARAVALYAKNSETPFDQIKYIEIGPPRFHSNASTFREGLVSGLHMLFNKTSSHSFSSSINTTRELIGEENTHLLYVRSDKRHVRGNLLNSSEQSIRQLDEMTREYLNGEGRDTFNRVCSLMLENSVLKKAPAPDTAFGFLKMFKSKEKSPPPSQAAATISVAPA